MFAISVKKSVTQRADCNKSRERAKAAAALKTESCMNATKSRKFLFYFFLAHKPKRNEYCSVRERIRKFVRDNEKKSIIIIHI
jgi:hypothetical protein